ncbi:TetR/AcrR family transcriptional regulator [Neotabrizicola shimadae]|uniref:TetR/AcrR family transcriptional regulator n=1 Tax=Neotabrizicola shimadae TaxID=2807096 RepID=A0A8G1EBU7_9RHOB|nr:TetR/AcrR family transcriptional regulator [Neotabrizicola shimadae]QYZ69777.1 TetR/AcrR family transcriptional regulator [Neotabrizicola shimadae]
MTVKSPGRPKDLEKREAILDAAVHLFAEKGIQGAPIEAIAAASGVSKVTVYAHFGDKAAILEAIVKRETDRLSHELTAEIGGEGNLEDRLVRFGMALVNMLGEPCHQALDRALSLEAHRNSDVARRFFDAGPGRVRQLLASLLTEAMARGEIAEGDAVQSAEDLMSLWLGFGAMQRRFIDCGKSTAMETESTVRRAVRLYLRGSLPATA